MSQFMVDFKDLLKGQLSRRWPDFRVFTYDFMGVCLLL